MSLPLHTVWSAALLFALWKVSYLNLPQVKFQFPSYSVAEETGLSLPLTETLKTDFCRVETHI